MDEMARQLGVSKKTLYLHVKDKNELVEACLEHVQECDLIEIKEIFDKKLNAVEELLEIGRHILKQLSSIHPSIFFDLSKYHPNSLKLMHDHKYNHVRGFIMDNLNKGVKEGLYRSNLTPEIISRIHMATMDLVMTGDVVPEKDYKKDEVYSEFFRYHIRGLASKKGLEYLEELIKKDENL
jgi:AcrR family transcriptional regulator